MELVRVENNVAVEIVSVADPSSLPAGDWRPVSLDGGVHVGADVRMYDADWQPRPMQELIDEGIVTLADDEKLHDGQIVKKTRYDRIVDGDEELGEREYLDDDIEEVKHGTLAELVDRGRMTSERANELAAPGLDAECQRRIEERWPLYAQQNAIDGVYGEESLADMRQWRDSHRAVYHALLERDDLFSIDVTSDELWPAD